MTSKPLSSKIRNCVNHHTKFAVIAQTVERNIGNVEVTGSIPVSSLKPRHICWGFLIFMEMTSQPEVL